MRRAIISYSQPIRFVRLDPEHAQSDRKSVNRRRLVLDLPRGRAILDAKKRSAASMDENAVFETVARSFSEKI